MASWFRRHFHQAAQIDGLTEAVTALIPAAAELPASYQDNDNGENPRIVGTSSVGEQVGTTEASVWNGFWQLTQAKSFYGGSGTMTGGIVLYDGVPNLIGYSKGTICIDMATPDIYIYSGTAWKKVTRDA